LFNILIKAEVCMQRQEQNVVMTNSESSRTGQGFSAD
jgi:hypothetical protein